MFAQIVAHAQMYALLKRFTRHNAKVLPKETKLS
jgi:hypothetical protein